MYPIVMLHFSDVNSQEQYVPAHRVIDAIVSTDGKTMTIDWQSSDSGYRRAQVHPETIYGLKKQLGMLEVSAARTYGEQDV